MPSPYDRCPVCLSTSVSPALEKSGHSILRCADCGLRYCDTEPAGESLARLYGADYFTGGGAGYEHYIADEPTHRRQARRYLARLARLGIAPGARLLDVGCAAGFFLDEARRAGWRVQGVDVSAYAVAHARDVLGLDVRCADFLAADLPAGGFDVVTIFNVFEHLRAPRATAERLLRLLRPGGHLVIETWDADALAARLLGRHWHQYSPAYVPYYYCRRSLARLFGPGAWRLVDYGPWAKWISVERACAILGAATGARPLRDLFRAIGRSRVGRVELPYTLGDLVLLTLQRRLERRQPRPSLGRGLPAHISRERRRASGVHPPPTPAPS